MFSNITGILLPHQLPRDQQRVSTLLIVSGSLYILTCFFQLHEHFIGHPRDRIFKDVNESRGTVGDDTS
jgi:hypothetical protein